MKITRYGFFILEVIIALFLLMGTSCLVMRFQIFCKEKRQNLVRRFEATTIGLRIIEELVNGIDPTPVIKPYTLLIEDIDIVGAIPFVARTIKIEWKTKGKKDHISFTIGCTK